MTQKIVVSTRRPQGRPVPLFVIGIYETMAKPAITIFYSPEHKAAALGLRAGNQ